MPHLKLSYFDFNGGRGEAARLALAIGGIAFEDHRVPVSDWPSVRERTPFHALPVLEVDGTVITQSNTINRFVGKLAGLYPTDDVEAAYCDEVMDAVEDIVTQVVVTFNLADAAVKQAAREALASGPIPLYLTKLQEMLLARGGSHFADKRLTVADLKVYVWIGNLRSGVLDHIPTNLSDRLSPLLVEHHDRIAADPSVAAYYETH